MIEYMTEEAVVFQSITASTPSVPTKNTQNPVPERKTQKLRPNIMDNRKRPSVKKFYAESFVVSADSNKKKSTTKRSVKGLCPLMHEGCGTFNFIFRKIRISLFLQRIRIRIKSLLTISLVSF